MITIKNVQHLNEGIYPLIIAKSQIVHHDVSTRGDSDDQHVYAYGKANAGGDRKRSGESKYP